MAKINVESITLKLKTDSKALVKEATRIAEDEYFYPAVKNLQYNFEDDDVTQEIEDGVGASNISDTLSDIPEEYEEGRNLFSFIGFDQGTNPVDELRPFFDPSHPDGPKIRYLKGSSAKGLEFRFAITIPDKDKIYNATPMPWAPGLSWVDRIEKGIPGLGHFLNKEGKAGSRSGGGIQLKNQIRSGRFKNRSYLTKLLKEFLKDVKGSRTF